MSFYLCAWTAVFVAKCFAASGQCEGEDKVAKIVLDGVEYSFLSGAGDIESVMKERAYVLDKYRVTELSGNRLFLFAKHSDKCSIAEKGARVKYDPEAAEKIRFALLGLYYNNFLSETLKSLAAFFERLQDVVKKEESEWNSSVLSTLRDVVERSKLELLSLSPTALRRLKRKLPKQVLLAMIHRSVAMMTQLLK